jgi:hypothetical protein
MVLRGMLLHNLEICPRVLREVPQVVPEILHRSLVKCLRGGQPEFESVARRAHSDHYLVTTSLCALLEVQRVEITILPLNLARCQRGLREAHLRPL